MFLFKCCTLFYKKNSKPRFEFEKKAPKGKEKVHKYKKRRFKKTTARIASMEKVVKGVV